MTVVFWPCSHTRLPGVHSEFGGTGFDQQCLGAAGVTLGPHTWSPIVAQFHEGLSSVIGGCATETPESPRCPMKARLVPIRIPARVLRKGMLRFSVGLHSDEHSKPYGKAVENAELIRDG